MFENNGPRGREKEKFWIFKTDKIEERIIQKRGSTKKEEKKTNLGTPHLKSSLPLHSAQYKQQPKKY